MFPTSHKEEDLAGLLLKLAIAAAAFLFGCFLEYLESANY